jgi:hypothetical protein
MYFWRIEKLKKQMTTRPLSAREVLPYLIVFVALSTAVGYIPQATRTVWDGLGAVWSVLLAIVGSIYIYRQNGGPDGEHFLQRYLAVGWVVTIRWLVVLIGVGVAFYATLAAVGAGTDNTHWYDFLFFAIIEAVLYWRIGHHVRDLASRTAA